MKRDFLAITDFTKVEILEVFDLTTDLKNRQSRGEEHHILSGKAMAMIFAKPSTRTRVSFEVGMFQLGGHALYLGPNDIQIGKRESVADVAQTLSRFVDIAMARLFAHDDIVELAENASVPIINGLTDLLHPCQVMADWFTVYEEKGRRDDLKIAFIGDGNNMANSWLNMAERFRMRLHFAIPDGYDPDAKIFDRVRRSGVSEIEITRSPFEAVKDADVIYTDVWASMGQESEAEKRKNDFHGFQIDQKLLNQADKDCIVMHCLPAHRGEEISAEVIDGPNSIVFDQAENRLHVQKGIIVKLMQ